MYEYVGKASPFLVLAALGVFDGSESPCLQPSESNVARSSIVLQLTVLQPAVSGEPIEGASLKALIKDPYILVAAGRVDAMRHSSVTAEHFRCNFVWECGYRDDGAILAHLDDDDNACERVSTR